MPSSTLPGLPTALTTPQPTMLLYTTLSPFGATDDRKITADDLFSIITANVSGDPNITAANVAAGNQVIYIHQSTSGAIVSVGTFPALLNLQETDSSTYWLTAYVNDAASHRWGLFVNNTGGFTGQLVWQAYTTLNASAGINAFQPTGGFISFANDGLGLVFVNQVNPATIRGAIWDAGLSGGLAHFNLGFTASGSSLGAPTSVLEWNDTPEVIITGKLTVTGAIDPTSVRLSSGTNLYYESADGQTAAVSAANEGRIRYNQPTQKWQVSMNGAAYVDIATGSGAVAWNAITNPAGNLALTMAANTSTFTYNAATGANDLFVLTTGASDTGTGYLLSLSTPGAGNTKKPFGVSVRSALAFEIEATGAPTAPDGSTSERFGSGSHAGGANACAFGFNTNARADSDIAIGKNASCSFGGGVSNIAIGRDCTVGVGQNSVGIGFNVQISAATGFCIGIGYQAAVSADNAMAFGRDSVANATGDVVFGSGNAPVVNGYFGNGKIQSVPADFTFNASGGNGADIAGANLNLAAGRPTGAGASGLVNIQHARPAGSSSTLQTLATTHSFFADADEDKFTQTCAHGATSIIGQIEENVTLDTGSTTTDTTIDLPANSIILAVSTRVTTAITTSTTFSVGDPTTAQRFSSTAAGLTLGSTRVGLNQMQGSITTDAAGPVQVTTAKVRITLDANPGAGAIRVTIHYITITAPTS